MNKFLGYIFLLLLSGSSLIAQDVMMQGWYWDFPKTTDGGSWANALQSDVNDLKEGGFTYLWLPPSSRTSSGNNSNGYDPKDLFDLGEFGLGATHFGTRSQVDALINSLNSAGIKAVADVVYNHRDGGKPDNNSAVRDYITNYLDSGENPYPSDRFRCILPLGGTTGHGAGDYYFKISSKTQDNKYFGKDYKLYMQTNTVGWQGLSPESESEPNGGGDCGESNDDISLGRDWLVEVDGIGCKTDEFHLNLTASDFNSAGDTLFIYLVNENSDYSDHRIYGVWSGAENTDIVGDIIYQTYTDFTSMPSGRGSMNFENFTPNSANASTTGLQGDWDFPGWFYDYNHDNSATRDTLIAWSKWLWNDVGYRGFRMDAVKHFNPGFVSTLLNQLHASGIDPGIVVGEYFDTNPNTLKSWVDNVKSGMSNGAKNAINPRTFDFSLRKALKDACDSYGYDVRNVFQSGLVDAAGSSGYDVITFINNHDYREAGKPVQNDAILAYAYILTNNKVGLPCVFYPDYFGVSIPNAPTQELQEDIDLLIEAHQNYIFGASQIDYINRFSTPNYIYYHTHPEYMDRTTLIYQIKGGGGNPNNEVIVAINFAGEDLEVEFGLSPMSSMLAGDKLYDILGKSQSPVMEVNSSNHCTLQLPPRSCSVWTNNPVSSDKLGPILYVDKEADGLNNGKNWENAFLNLSSAIEVAKINPQITEIWVKEGTYYPSGDGDRNSAFELSNKIKIYGSFPQTSNPNKSDRDVDSYPTILSGDIGIQGDNSDNCYNIIKSTTSSEKILDGFVLENGNANGGQDDEKTGAGIYNLGDLSIKNVHIKNCSSTLNGSHVFSSGTDAHLTIDGCKFIFKSSQTEATIYNSANSTMEFSNTNRVEKE